MDKEIIKRMERQEQAVKGFAALGLYMASRNTITPEVADAYQIIKDWLFEGDKNE